MHNICLTDYSLHWWWVQKTNFEINSVFFWETFWFPLLRLRMMPGNHKKMLFRCSRNNVFKTFPSKYCVAVKELQNLFVDQQNQKENSFSQFSSFLIVVASPAFSTFSRSLRNIDFHLCHFPWTGEIILARIVLPLLSPAHMMAYYWWSSGSYFMLMHMPSVRLLVHIFTSAKWKPNLTKSETKIPTKFD